MIPEDETCETAKRSRTDKVGCQGLNLSTNLGDQHQLWCHRDNINVQSCCPERIKDGAVVKVGVHQHCENKAAQPNVLNLDVVMLFLVSGPVSLEDAIEDVQQYHHTKSI